VEGLGRLLAARLEFAGSELVSVAIFGLLDEVWSEVGMRELQNWF
jgi:hypothetical protein